MHSISLTCRSLCNFITFIITLYHRRKRIYMHVRTFILYFYNYNVSERFEKKACNSLFWAPSGQFIVLAGLRNLGGTLEFVDTNDFSIMNSTEHFSCSDVEWDPTGRYVVTAVSFWKAKVSKLHREQ